MSRRELEICDWNLKGFPTKVQAWEVSGVVEPKETWETSKRKTREETATTKKAEGWQVKWDMWEPYHYSREHSEPWLSDLSHISIMGKNITLLFPLGIKQIRANLSESPLACAKNKWSYVPNNLLKKILLTIFFTQRFYLFIWGREHEQVEEQEAEGEADTPLSRECYCLCFIKTETIKNKNGFR